MEKWKTIPGAKKSDKAFVFYSKLLKIGQNSNRKGFLRLKDQLEEGEVRKKASRYPTAQQNNERPQESLRDLGWNSQNRKAS